MDRRPATQHFTPKQSASILAQSIQRRIDGLISSLPVPEHLSPEERRGVIARYTAVLEANFIYWMTATYLSVSSNDAKIIVQENLREEVRDNHPGMLRRFAVAAHAVPTDSDHFLIHRRLQDVRHFVSGLDGIQLLLMMVFFEGFIARFMPYLAGLAVKQGSSECEYTTVHGAVDVTHTQELLRAFDAEVSASHKNDYSSSPFHGVDVLQRLLEIVILSEREAEHP